MTTPLDPVSVTVSGEFLSHLRRLLVLALDDLVADKPFRRGLNWHAEHGLVAYVSAVASVEAFVNAAARLDRALTEAALARSSLVEARTRCARSTPTRLAICTALRGLSWKPVTRTV